LLRVTTNLKTGLKERQMNSKDYNKNVLKTLSGDMEAIKKRLEDPSTIDMVHAAMGMVTEAAEIMDMVKKHIFYGKDLDLVNAEEELGDSNWYQSVMIHSMKMKGHMTTWENIWEKNINKLKARYGHKFSEAAAVNRDLDKEREILERRHEENDE
jgi:hypothetical protein